MTSTLPASLVLLVAWGVASTLVIANGIALRQQLTPDRLQGRVNVTARMIAYGGTPIGAAAGGFLADQINIRTALLLMTLRRRQCHLRLGLTAAPHRRCGNHPHAGGSRAAWLTSAEQMTVYYLTDTSDQAIGADVELTRCLRRRRWRLRGLLPPRTASAVSEPLNP